MSSLVTQFLAGRSRNNYTGYVGFKFVAASYWTVSTLGLVMDSGNSGNHNVYLLDGSGKVLASAIINLTGGIPGNFYYAPVTPVVLLAGATYYLVTQVISGDGQSWGDNDGNLAINPALGESVVSVYSSVLGHFAVGAASTTYSGLDINGAVSAVGTGGGPPVADQFAKIQQQLTDIVTTLNAQGVVLQKILDALLEQSHEIHQIYLAVEPKPATTIVLSLGTPEPQ